MPRLLQDWVTRQAERRPEATAVVAGGRRLTYAEWDGLSNRLARLLRQAGCRRGDRVALLMSHSPLALVALVGIYKADAIYVPLDPGSPAARLRRILDACGSRLLLAGGPVAGVLEELFHGRPAEERPSIGWLDDGPPVRPVDVRLTPDDLARAPATPLAAANGPHDPAHILFTSGSTGTPKGVVISHASVVAFVEWATRYFGMDASDRVSGHPPLQFDISFLDIFGTAAVGGELHLVPPELNVLPNKLADFIRASELTQWFSVPSVLTYLARFDVVRPGDFPRMRRLLWAGEVLPTPTLIHWMKRLPHVAFTNLYGPTETTVASSHYTVPACPEDPQAPIPIGAACAGEELLVLGESMEEVPRGEAGELCIGGVGLSPGYWRDPRQTATAFVPHPRRPGERIYRTGDRARVDEDGALCFLGRADAQIKSRGYRIELGEIEAALNALPSVQEAVVVAGRRSSFGGAVVCCAYVPAPGAEVTPARLRLDLGRLVPAFMLPAHWLAFDHLPRNGNGKADRRRLQELFEERPIADAAQTA
jgi:amino acid adenylation domain-containing protein